MRKVRYSLDLRSHYPGYKAIDISSTLSEKWIRELAWEMRIPPICSIASHEEVGKGF